MNKRFISMVLVLVLSLSFTATAGASTVSDEVPLSDVNDDAISSDTGCLEQSSEIAPDAEDGMGTEQPDDPLHYPLDLDENGYDEIIIELDPIPTDVSELDSDGSISTEDGSSIDTNPEEGIEPNASTPEDYPITSFTTCWVSGAIAGENGIPKFVKKSPSNYIYKDTSPRSCFSPDCSFLHEESIRICFYLDGYSGHGKVIERNGKGYDVHLASNKGTNLDADGAATAFYQEYEVCGIDPCLTHLKLTFTGWSRDDKTQWIRDVYLKFEGDRDPAPTSPEFYFDPDNPEQYTLRGLSDKMEYRRGYYGSWKPCTEESMTISTKFAGEDFLVRYQAVDGKPESEFIEVTMPSLREAPTIGFNWVDESFTHLTTEMEFSFGDSDYSPVTNDIIADGVTPFLDAVTGPGYVPLLIRYKHTDSQPASYAKTIKVYPRADKPDDAKLSVDQNTYILMGVTSSMQYIGPGDTAWKAISGTSVNLSNYVKNGDTVTIWVRTKSSTGKSYSTPVPKHLEPPAPAPNTLDIDCYNEKITGFQNGVKYQYKIGTGSWTSLTPKNNEFSIASLITSKDREISIRIPGTADSKMSGKWTEQIPARIPAPDCSFVYNDSANIGSAVLTGLETGMEYQLKGETTWTSYWGQNIVIPLPSANKTYYVRVAATDSSFASTKKTLTLYAPGTAPTSSLNITTENITISKTAEYRIDNGAYTKLPSDSTTLSATEFIDKLSGAETRTITVRYAATETKPASKEKTITLVARREGPTTMQFDAASQKITGATTSMQYRVKGTTAWKTVTSKTFSIASLLDGQTNIVLEFRYKPTNSLVGSKITELNCF